MADDTNDDDIELLGELGVEAETGATGGRTPKEQRIIAGFEEIERFVEEHGRLPQHGESRDIFERLYAVRLDRIRESAECRAVLTGLDSRGLLGPDREPTEGRVEEPPERYREKWFFDNPSIGRAIRYTFGERRKTRLGRRGS